MRLDELVLRHSSRLAHKCAAVAGERRLTYGELALAVDHAAEGLRRRGIDVGDTVLVQLPNDLEFLVLVLALMRLGAPATLALPALREYELDRIARLAKPVAIAVPRRLRRFNHLALARRVKENHPSVRFILVTDGDGADEDLSRLCGLAERRADPAFRQGGHARANSSTPALLLLSSGTTGPPKLIAHSHEEYGYVIRTTAALAGLSEDSVYLAVMPVNHSFALSYPGILGTLAVGGSVVLDSIGDPHRPLELIERERVTHSAVVPGVAAQWLDAARESRHDLASLQVLQVGGAKLSASVATEIQRSFDCRLQQVYGMSEGFASFTRLDDPDPVAIETQGRSASPGDEIAVVDESETPVSAGERGELLTRGPFTVAGYYRDPDATARSFTADGFYRTGDMVRLLPSGNIVVVGRIKNVINRGGEKVCAEEVEAMVLEHPEVKAAATIGMPHPLYGEAVCQFVVRDKSCDLTIQELRRFLQSRGLASFKLPERLEVVDSLPVTGTGKVDRGALREEIAARLERREIS